MLWFKLRFILMEINNKENPKQYTKSNCGLMAHLPISQGQIRDFFWSGSMHWPKLKPSTLCMPLSRKNGEWVDSLLAPYKKTLFSNENSAKPPYCKNINCPDDDNMITMEHQLIAHTSKSVDSPSTKSLVLEQVLHLLPPPP
ncbi:hypothetical protein EDD22DRAFT_849181 [Suillus occidentalis]|nr:hypothetical protein EDD22DRAFT_849181 [Suillus occidentalis]